LRTYGYGAYPVVYFNSYTASTGDVEEDDDGNPIQTDPQISNEERKT